MNSGRTSVDVSAIVVTYNRDAPLRHTLECLLKQDPSPAEIIVVDQSPNHDAATQGFLDALIAGRQIRYIFHSRPNAQRARNCAIQEASSEVLLFVDDDVTMDEGLVGAHWQNYADRDLAAVCGFYVEPGQDRGADLPPPLAVLPDYCKEPVTGWIYFPHSYLHRQECYSFPTCNGSIRRDVAMRLGGFDENYVYTHFDDTDFSCRLKALGAKAVHDPQARLVHLKALTGGNRPGGRDAFVIADRACWYTWCYFFWMNFRWRGWRELTKRFRTCVLRGPNIYRPWYLAIAFHEFTNGAARAVWTIRSGRKLGIQGGRLVTTPHESVVCAS